MLRIVDFMGASMLMCVTAASAAAQPGGTVVVVPPAGSETTVVTEEVVREPIERGRIEGRHRLHIDTSLLSWRRYMPWVEDMMGPKPSAVDTVDFIGGVPALGVPGLGPTGNFGIGYAYGVTDRIIIGARLGLGFQHMSTTAPDRQATGMFGYSVTPYFEFVGRPGHDVRPFINIRVGLGGSVSASKNGDVTTRTSTIGPMFGVGLGLHAFLTERVSLDPAVTFDYALVWGRGTVKPMPAGMEAPKWEKSAMVPNLGVMLGLSVWLGRDDDDDDDDDRRRRRRRSAR
jgi:hypothetical protein